MPPLASMVRIVARYEGISSPYIGTAILPARNGKSAELKAWRITQAIEPKNERVERPANQFGRYLGSTEISPAPTDFNARRPLTRRGRFFYFR